MPPVKRAREARDTPEESEAREAREAPEESDAREKSEERKQDDSDEEYNRSFGDKESPWEGVFVHDQPELMWEVNHCDGQAPFNMQSYSTSLTSLQPAAHMGVAYPPMRNLVSFLRDLAQKRKPFHVVIHRGSGAGTVKKQFIEQVENANGFSDQFPKKGTTTYKIEVVNAFEAVFNLIEDQFELPAIDPCHMRKLVLSPPFENPYFQLDILVDYLVQ